MKKTDVVENLRASLAQLEKAKNWLVRSHDQSKKIGIKKSYVPDEMDVLENLSSRFARVSDILIQKVHRSRV